MKLLAAAERNRIPDRGPSLCRIGPATDDLADDTLLAGFAGGDAALALAFVRRFQRQVYVCPDCRQELAAYSNVVDRLVAATPEVEPPVGFESRVLALGDCAVGHRSRPSGDHPVETARLA